MVKKMRGQSGFGWDDTTKTPTATKEVWEPFLKVSIVVSFPVGFVHMRRHILQQNPKAKDLFDQPFPLYDDLSLLVDGSVTTGNYVFRSGKGGQSGMAASSNAPPVTPARSQGDAASSSPPPAQRSVSEPFDGLGEDRADNTDTVSLSVLFLSIIYSIASDPYDTSKEDRS